MVPSSRTDQQFETGFRAIQRILSIENWVEPGRVPRVRSGYLYNDVNNGPLPAQNVKKCMLCLLHIWLKDWRSRIPHTPDLVNLSKASKRPQKVEGSAEGSTPPSPGQQVVFSPQKLGEFRE